LRNRANFSTHFAKGHAPFVPLWALRGCFAISLFAYYGSSLRHDGSEDVVKVLLVLYPCGDASTPTSRPIPTHRS
jgi:hypothetical protein